MRAVKELALGSSRMDGRAEENGVFGLRIRSLRWSEPQK